MDLRFIDIPKIDNDILLEDLVKDIVKADSSYQNVNVHGRPGQKQDGVDLYARLIDSGNWIGIQCKVRSTNKAFTKAELLNEVNQAKSFNPTISKYFLYTTLNRDTKTQKLERTIQDELQKAKSFSFQIYFWDDIKDFLREEQNETVYYRWYYRYFKDNLVLGHSIGKLLNLELCFDNKSDTHCELIIGKIPEYKTHSDKKNVNYFRGTYYIINLVTKKVEFFNKKQDSNKVECYSSDIIHAFNNKIDSYRICKWLEDIEDIDKFIYDDEHNYEFSITSQERHEYNIAE